MSHLSPERLAALADAGEIAHPDEVEHLAACYACAADRAAMRTLVAAARTERFAVGAPLTRWEGIAAGLRSTPAGTPVTAPGGSTMARSPRTVDVAARRRVFTAVTRAAAAVLLLAGGAAAGRLSAVTGPLSLASMPEGTGTGRPDARLAAYDAAERFESVAEAEAALARHEEGYQRAAAFLARNDTTAWVPAPDGYQTRLVALENAGRTIREAMEDAPYDPVLTGYYLTTLGQREATLRQLNVAVPAGARLNTF